MNKPIKLTVSGFGPFLDFPKNPSELVLDHLQPKLSSHSRFRLRTVTFPVIYEGALKRIRATVEQTLPDIWLMTGIASDSATLRLERYAHNRYTSSQPDIDNVIRHDGKIHDSGPDKYRCGLPLEPLAAALEEMGIPAVISEDAGGYICNHYYYLAQQVLTHCVFPSVCLFIHLPDWQQIEDADSKWSLTLVAEAMSKLANLIADLE